MTARVVVCTGKVCFDGQCTSALASGGDYCFTADNCLGGFFMPTTPHTFYPMDCAQNECAGLGAKCVADDGTLDGVAMNLCISGAFSEQRRKRCVLRQTHRGGSSFAFVGRRLFRNMPGWRLRNGASSNGRLAQAGQTRTKVSFATDRMRCWSRI